MPAPDTSKTKRHNIILLLYTEKAYLMNFVYFFIQLHSMKYKKQFMTSELTFKMSNNDFNCSFSFFCELSISIRKETCKKKLGSISRIHLLYRLFLYPCWLFLVEWDMNVQFTKENLIFTSKSTKDWNHLYCVIARNRMSWNITQTEDYMKRRR